MKRFLTISCLVVAILVSGAFKNTVSAQRVGISISYQTFYDELSPYGRWIEYPEYGYVWAPDMGSEFQPYSTGGHWAWSDEYEWMWVSDYAWGWAPFHYGRWFHDPFYGWMWVPGYEWSPAWVSWRTGGDYYGWAPIRPGINISIGFGSYNPPSNYWCFAPRRYIGSRQINNYYIDRSRNTTIIHNTTVINNYGNRNNVFVNGPRRHEAERYAGSIRPVRFRDSDKPGRRDFRNNQVSIYRPQIKRDNNRNFAPKKFDRYNRDERGNGNANRRNAFDRNPDRRGNNSPGEARPFERKNNDGHIGNNDRRNNRNENRRQNIDARETRPDNRSNENRNVFERNENNPGNNRREIRRDERRNNEVQQADINRRERRNVFDRNTNRSNNETRDVRQFESSSNDASQNSNRRIERREIEKSNSAQQQGRRGIRNDPPRQRQIERQPQQQPRLETRNNDNRNQENRGSGRGRFERRDG